MVYQARIEDFMSSRLVYIYVYGRTDFNICIYDWSPIDPMSLLIITKFSLQMITDADNVRIRFAQVGG